MTKEEKVEYRRKNRLIYEWMGAKPVRKGVDVNIYVGDQKVLKMGTWSEKQAWEASTDPTADNLNNSWSRLLPIFFKIVKARGKEHSVSQELVEMLLTEDLDNFYNIIVNYVEADKNGFAF